MQTDLIDSLLRIHFDAGNKYENAHREGDDFNVFRLINEIYWIDEPKHSRFISFLLNPKESHGQKDLYLSLFLEKLGVEYRSEKQRNWNIFAEKDNVDILIQSTYPDKISIVIENKCYDAKDQANQLYRYWKECIYDFHKDQTNGHLNITKNRVIYLPKGSWKTYSENSVCKPDASLPDMNTDIITSWTIQGEINEWLSACIQQTKSYRIKKFIEDYQNFWSETNLKNSYMKAEIEKKITTFEDWNALSEVMEMKTQLQQEWLNIFYAHMKNLAESTGWQFYKENENDYRIFRKNQNHLSFCFEYSIGITLWDQRLKDKNVKNIIKSRIVDLLSNIGDDFEFIDEQLNDSTGYILHAKNGLNDLNDVKSLSQFAFIAHTKNIYEHIRNLLEKYLKNEDIKKQFDEWSDVEIAKLSQEN